MDCAVGVQMKIAVPTNTCLDMPNYSGTAWSQKIMLQKRRLNTTFPLEVDIYNAVYTKITYCSKLYHRHNYFFLECSLNFLVGIIRS